MIKKLDERVVGLYPHQDIELQIFKKVNELIDIENSRTQNYANILKENFSDKYYEIYPDEKPISSLNSLTSSTSTIDSTQNLGLAIEQIGNSDEFTMKYEVSEKPKFPSNTFLYEHYGNECPTCNSSYKRKFILGIFPYILKPKHCINPDCVNYFGNYVSN